MSLSSNSNDNTIFSAVNDDNVDNEENVDYEGDDYEGDYEGDDEGDDDNEDDDKGDDNNNDEKDEVVKRMMSHNQVLAIKSQIKVSQDLLQAHQERYEELESELENLNNKIKDEEIKIKELRKSIQKVDGFRSNDLLIQLYAVFDNNVIAELVFSYVSYAVWCEDHKQWSYAPECWNCILERDKRVGYIIQGDIECDWIDYNAARSGLGRGKVGERKDICYKFCNFHDLEFYKFCQRLECQGVFKDFKGICISKSDPTTTFGFWLCLNDRGTVFINTFTQFDFITHITRRDKQLYYPQ